MGTTTETRVYEDNSGTHPTAVLYTQVLSTGKAPVREFYDLLGRTVRVRSQGFDGSYVNQDTQYDSQGRVERGPRSPILTAMALTGTPRTYDFLGRVTAVAAADPVKSVTRSLRWVLR